MSDTGFLTKTIGRRSMFEIVLENGEKIIIRTHSKGNKRKISFKCSKKIKINTIKEPYESNS